MRFHGPATYYIESNSKNITGNNELFHHRKVVDIQEVFAFANMNQQKTPNGYFTHYVRKMQN